MTPYKYKPADKSFVLNCGHPSDVNYDPDPDLIPIRLSLPDPPDLELIDGYGLPPSQQVFKRKETPEKLVILEKMVKKELEYQNSKNDHKKVTPSKIHTAIWKKLEENQDDYEDEIKWIADMWYFRLYGYWFFCNGKPTYICGWHFFFLTPWFIDGKFNAEYRDRDRRELLGWHYVYNTQESVIMNEEGVITVEEMAFKTFYGIIEPKGRRQGVSNKAQACQLEIISRISSALGVIFSITEKSASDLFKDITTRALRKIPFYFSPLMDTPYDSAKKISYFRPAEQPISDDLQSLITFPDSGEGNEFDGRKIDCAIYDEEAKSKDMDVQNRWNKHKRAQALGPNIIGFSWHISTIEEMQNGGGEHFRKMIHGSMFYNRVPLTGQTETGLATIFFASYDGFEKCIDKFGNSVIDHPTAEDKANGYKLNYGAKELIQSELDQLLNSKDPAKKTEYLRTRVKFPFKLADCFNLTIGGSVFNMDIINTALAQIRRMKPPVRGNFRWVDGIRFGRVEFCPDPDGRFEISLLLDNKQSNQKIKKYQFDPLTNENKTIWAPSNGTKGTVGCDPVKYKGDKQIAIETGRYDSASAIAIYKERDKTIDPDSKPIQDHETGCFIGTYINRLLTDQYNEDALMCAIYYGYMICIERNQESLWQYLVQCNHEGYLFYAVDPATGKEEQKPGFYISEDIKETMWRLFQNFIEYRGLKVKHATLLMQIANLKVFDDLRKNDLAASAAECLLASDNKIFTKREDVPEQDDDFMKEWLRGKINWNSI
jgi:hypothetical protein